MQPLNRDDIRWRDDYEMGYPRIDGEHRYLVRLVHQALDALDDERPDDFFAVSERFVETCRHHFFSEEQLLHEIGFEGLDQHRKYHTKLLDMAEAINLHREPGQDIERLRTEFMELAKCLLHDVIRGDEEFLPFLRRSGLV